MIWFVQNSGAHSLQQLTTTVPVQQLGSPWQAQRPGCLTQMAFILLKPAPSCYSQNSWALATWNWTLLQVPNRPAPRSWDFNIQRESSHFLGCQVAPGQWSRSGNKSRFQSLFSSTKIVVSLLPLADGLSMNKLLCDPAEDSTLFQVSRSTIPTTISYSSVSTVMIFTEPLWHNL